MRRLHLGLFGVLTPALVLSGFLVGCGNPTTPSAPPDTKVTDTKPTAKMEGIKPGKGVLKGRVTVVGGMKPEALLVKATEDLKTAVDKNTQAKDFCTKGDPKDKTKITSLETEQQHYRIDDKGNVENVFVWIQPVDKNSFFEIDPVVLKKFEGQQVTIDQPHCAFLPHAAFLFPSYRDPKDGKKLIPTGQKVFVANSAVVTHNTKWGDKGKNPGDNLTLPEGAKQVELKEIIPSTAPITLECNIHAWMNGYLWALDHPYAAITKADGTYEIDGIPTGVKVKLMAWHEGPGFLTGDKGEDLELKDATEKNLEINLSK